MMKAKDVLYIATTVENEGFDYAFVNYSAFDEIKDEEFHALRKGYLEARNKLASYVGFEDEVQDLG